MSPFKIRLAVMEDLTALTALMRSSVEALSVGYYGPDQTRAAANCITVPDSMLIQDGTMFVAHTESELIGCGAWSAREKLYTGGEALDGDARLLDPATEAARVRAFFVLPSWARNGVGRAIYLSCEDQARRAGFARLELMATLPGVPFYEQLGFVAEERVDIRLTEGVTLPGRTMSKRLS
jgi:GNAT superfamily N-acetyltransferase